MSKWTADEVIAIENGGNKKSDRSALVGCVCCCNLPPCVGAVLYLFECSVYSH